MTFHLHTYGCQMNVRDSEAVEALLAAAGHVRVEDEADAELVIVNSCTVRDMAERKAVGKCGNLIAAKQGRAAALHRFHGGREGVTPRLRGIPSHSGRLP